MKGTQDYEKLVIEIQTLKKACGNEKIAHQATIDQLQVSYELNQQLQNVIKSQGKTIADLNEQLNERTIRLSEISASYQVQLNELKQFVNLKDRELQGIRGSLMVTDYDMIRLRVISQLQLVHRDQLEELNKEIQRINKMMEQEKTQNKILQEKFSYLKKQLNKQKDNFYQQMQQVTKKNIIQCNKMRDRCENEGRAKKQIQRLYQALKQKYRILKQTYQNQMNKDHGKLDHKTYKQKSGSQNYHNQLNKITKLQTSLQQKHKELQNLNRKMQRQQARNQQIISDLESKLKEAKENAVEFNDHLQKVREKDLQLEQLRKSYEKKIKILKQDFDEELRRQKKDRQAKIQQFKQKIKTEKQNTHNNFQTNLKNVQKERYVQRQKQLEQRIIALQNQNEELSKKNHSEKHTVFQRTSRVTSMRQKKQQNGEKTHIFRTKLQQANRQIMSLLMEKVNLKQQISQLKR